MAKCSDLLLRALSEPPPLPEDLTRSRSMPPPALFQTDRISPDSRDGSQGSSATAAESADDRDEYERYGPPPKLAALARDSFLALQHQSARSSSDGGLPPEWRRINVMYPPYAMMQEVQIPEELAGEESSMNKGPSGEASSSATSGVQTGSTLYGPEKPPYHRGQVR